MAIAGIQLAELSETSANQGLPRQGPCGGRASGAMHQLCGLKRRQPSRGFSTCSLQNGDIAHAAIQNRPEHTPTTAMPYERPPWKARFEVVYFYWSKTGSVIVNSERDGSVAVSV
jgi:hypothetical protein